MSSSPGNALSQGAARLQLERSECQEDEFETVAVIENDDQIGQRSGPKKRSLEESSDSSETPVIKKRATSSVVWEHFTKDGTKKKYSCKYCLKTYGLATSTTPLMNHMRSTHHKILSKKEKPPVPACFAPHASGDAAEKFRMPKDQQLKIDGKLNEWIVADSQSFALVDVPEFRDFVNALNPLYDLCARTTQKSRIIKTFAEHRKLAIKALADVPSRISITLDSWTSNPQDSFLVITVHWINQEYELKEAVLDFIQISVSHTGENLKKVLLEALLEFNIAHKILCYTSDGAANMRTCFEHLQPALNLERIRYRRGSDDPEFRLRCVCHCLNLIADVGFQKTSSLIDVVRRLVIFLKRPKMKAEFRKFMEVQDLKLPLDVRTRWNSTFYMLKGAYEIRENLDRFLAIHEDSQPGRLLTATEWRTVEELIGLLQPLEVVTRECSGAEYATFHLVLEHLQNLLDHLGKSVTSNQAWISEVASKMKRKLEEIIADNWNQDPVLLAAILDPCLKSAGIPESMRNRAVEILREIFRQYSCKISDTAGSSTSSDDRITGLPALRGCETARTLKIRAILDLVGVQNEVDEYLASPLAPVCNALEWWKLNRAKYPVLGLVVIDYFAVCASSVASEREFSKAGNLITDIRNRLGPEAAQASLCLKSWYKNFKYG